MPPLNEQQVRAIVRDERSKLDSIDRYTIQKLMQFFDGRNIQFGKTTGTKLGTATDQKLAFHNSTPVIQHVSTGASGYSAVGGTNVDSNDTFTGGVDSTVYTIGDIVAALKLKGLIKS